MKPNVGCPCTSELSQQVWVSGCVVPRILNLKTGTSRTEFEFRALVTVSVVHTREQQDAVYCYAAFNTCR
jgi:hypothetical protein